MTDYLANRPREKYGKHVYSADQFGFTTSEYEPIFADYVAAYGAYL